MAKALGRSERTLRNWRAAAPDAQPRAGRPPSTKEECAAARALIAAELKRQGWDAGEGPVYRALRGRVSLWRVRRELRVLKLERRVGQRAVRAEHRRSIRVLARNSVWALDATHLARDPAGHGIEAEVLRDVASTRTLALSVGPKATSKEVIALLDAAVRARDGPPLVLVTDNASAYVCAAVDAWCARRHVVHLRSQPRTPQHNASAEHGIGELKRDAQIPEQSAVTNTDELLQTLACSVHRLDRHRPRATRSWRTAAVADSEAPPWCSRGRRQRFYSEAACAIRSAVLDSNNKRARRRAERNAILRTLERFKLIRCTRGAVSTRR